MQTQRVEASRGNEVNHAVNHLDEGVDQGLEGLLQRGLANHVGPQAEAVDELPVVHGVDATLNIIKCLYSVSVMDVIALRTWMASWRI